MCLAILFPRQGSQFMLLQFILENQYLCEYLKSSSLLGYWVIGLGRPVRVSQKALVDFIFIRALEVATQRGIPMQIHTGYVTFLFWVTRHSAWELLHISLYGTDLQLPNCISQPPIVKVYTAPECLRQLELCLIGLVTKTYSWSLQIPCIFVLYLSTRHLPSLVWCSCMAHTLSCVKLLTLLVSIPRYKINVTASNTLHAPW